MRTPWAASTSITSVHWAGTMYAAGGTTATAAMKPESFGSVISIGSAV